MQIQPNKPEAYKLIHQKYCHKTNKILTMKIKKLKKEFLKSKTGRLWGHIYNKPNLNSDLQLSNILYNKLHAEVKKTTEKGNPSTDNECIEALQKDFPELEGLVQYKKLSKMQGTYIQNILKETVNGVMRPSFSLHIPVTFRSFFISKY